METRQDIIDFCLTFPNVYEDYPFKDTNWTLMRHMGNRKNFATIYERFGQIWINVKCEPNMTFTWRNSFESVLPGYHMNKDHWNSIILDGTVPDDAIKNMIYDSFELTKPRRKTK